MSYPKLDADQKIRSRILPYCRLKSGDIWDDPEGIHRVGVLDAESLYDVLKIAESKRVDLVVNDPPYNISSPTMRTSALGGTNLAGYLDFTRKWVANAVKVMAPHSSLYIWLGASQNDGFAPLPEVMLLMREIPELESRSFITLRNQRGYGTQNNWMAVRQELLYYTKGKPLFQPAYTGIPKILRGYYKKIDGKRMENLERSKSPFIRAGNVWVDLQQVFYRMHENVPGAYAQKPLSAIERIINSSSPRDGRIADFFSHSGTTLIAAEKNARSCITFDVDPIFAELTIRRLERYRTTGKTGWQQDNPFPEVPVS